MLCCSWCEWVGVGECGCWEKLVIGKVKGSCECVVWLLVLVLVGGGGG